MIELVLNLTPVRSPRYPSRWESVCSLQPHKFQPTTRGKKLFREKAFKYNQKVKKQNQKKYRKKKNKLYDTKSNTYRKCKKKIYLFGNRDSSYLGISCYHQHLQRKRERGRETGIDRQRERERERERERVRERENR